jgi:hypothetical protein
MALLALMAAGLMIFVISRLLLQVGDDRQAQGTSGGRKGPHEAIDIGGRIALAIALLGVRAVAIYGFGAGYYSRFWIYAPTPYNVVVAGLLFLALLVALFWFVVRDPALEP